MLVIEGFTAIVINVISTVNPFRWMSKVIDIIDFARERSIWYTYSCGIIITLSLGIESSKKKRIAKYSCITYDPS
jgi:hypothetical protein